MRVGCNLVIRTYDRVERSARRHADVGGPAADDGHGTPADHVDPLRRGDKRVHTAASTVRRRA